MFGWRQVGDTGEPERRRYGFILEVFDTGMWLNLYLGKRWIALTRYARNRHTGPEDNRGVLAYFFGGKERRTRSRAFSDGFAAASKKAPVTRQKAR